MNNAMRTKTSLSKERKRRKWKKKIYDEEKTSLSKPVACEVEKEEKNEEEEDEKGSDGEER